MDASAYLISQGWAGSGHALHDSGRGISKPLLVSQKRNSFGVGKKQDHQWWARAFDDTLKEITITQSKESGKLNGIASTRPVVTSARLGGKGQLYSNFVKGECLTGTLTLRDGESASNEANASQTERIAQHKDKEITQHNDRASHGQRLGMKAATSTSMSSSAQKRTLDEMGTSSSEQVESKKQRKQRKREKKAQRALKGVI